MSSKIKVDTIENVAGSGNVSLGSGHNLVVPGDLTVDTSTLKVDSSNNRVGVGIASPTHPLSVNGQIKSTGSNGETVQLQTSSQYTGISFIGSDGTRDAIIDYDHTGGVMGIKAHTSAHKISMTTGGYSERLGIDADGRITMAAQPSFRAGMTANQTVAQNAVVTYQGTDHNIGNHFDTSSNVGRFTCPVAGRYLFGIAMGDGNNSGIAGIFALCKNGSRHYDFIEGGAPSGISGHYEKHASVVVNASANDYFDIRQISSGNKNLEGTSDGLSTRNRFWGHLLG